MSDLKQLVMFWNEKTAELLNMHTNPGHDTRRFAVVQIAVHDTLNYFEHNYKQYSQVFHLPNRYKRASIEESVNSAARVALEWVVNDIEEYNSKLITENLPPFAFNKQDWLNKIEGWYNEKKVIDDHNAKLLGQIWAEAIINNREADGSNSVDILSTLPPDGGLNETGVFRADFYKFPPAVPHDKNKLIVGFGNVIPLVLSAADQFRQQFNYTAAQRSIDFEEAKMVGSVNYNIDDEDLKNKVEYWSNIKQHVVWNDFARKIIQQHSLNAWQTARLFALIHTAMADGAISMFRDVFHFKHWRPVTAINAVAGVDPFDSNAWKPRYSTPRVPEYPSSFVIFGGAVGEILESIFTAGNIPQIDLTFINKDGNPKTITYNSISDAVDDNSRTKIYCGWNFKKSAEDSITQGRQIGRYILENKFKYNRKPNIPNTPRRPKHQFPKTPWIRKIYQVLKGQLSR